MDSEFHKQTKQIELLAVHEIRRLARSEGTYYSRWSEVEPVARKHDISDLDISFALREAEQAKGEIVAMFHRTVMIGTDTDGRRLKMTVNVKGNTIELLKLEVLEEVT